MGAGASASGHELTNEAQHPVYYNTSNSPQGDNWQELQQMLLDGSEFARDLSIEALRSIETNSHHLFESISSQLNEFLQIEGSIIEGEIAPLHATEELQIIKSFEVGLSTHPSISYGSDWRKVMCSSRSDQVDSIHELPVVLARCGSAQCCFTVRIIAAPRRDAYISFGLVCLDRRCRNTKIVDPIGIFPGSFGIVDRRNNHHAAKVCAGRCSPAECRVRTLMEGDQLELLLDTRSYKASFPAGYCVLILNGDVVHTFTKLDCYAYYAVGLTLADGYVVQLDAEHDVLRSMRLRASGSELSIAPNSEQRVSTIINETIETRVNDLHLRDVPLDTAVPESTHVASVECTTFDQVQPQNRVTDIESYRTLPLAQRTIPVPSHFPQGLRLLSPLSESARSQLRQQRIEEAVADSISNSVNEISARDAQFLHTVGRKVELSPRENEDKSEIHLNASSTYHTDARLCCICLAEDKCVLLLPCKHLCLCEECGIVPTGVMEVKHCPICRVEVNDRLRVFV